MKKLFVFCDGTNNTLTAGTRDTNVLTLYESLQACAKPVGEDWVFFYDPGVGSTSVVPPIGIAGVLRNVTERLSGLAFGKGIYENISQAYLFLMRNVSSPEDEIYVCGFSRGAFTARALTGMVNLFGVLRPEHESLIPTLLSVYFSRADDVENHLPASTISTKSNGTIRSFNYFLNIKKGNLDVSKNAYLPENEAPRSNISAQIRSNFAGPTRSLWINWIGVWDTVESVGLPGFLSKKISSSKTIIGKNIRHVRHGVSSNEHRYSFKPRLYDDPNFKNEDQSLVQKWFMGCHCDVGGSYAKSESKLSDLALFWLAEELFTELKILDQFKLLKFRLPNSRYICHDPLWDKPYWALAGMIVRKAPNQYSPGQDASDPSQHLTINPPDNIEIESVWEHRRSVKLLLLFLFFSIIFGWFSEFKSELSLKPNDKTFWAYICGIVYTASWGYLLARVSSRGFSYMVKDQTPFNQRAWWTAIGFVPMFVFAMALFADVLGILAIGLQSLQATCAAKWAGIASTFASHGIWFGLICCTPLLGFGVISYIKTKR